MSILEFFPQKSASVSHKVNFYLVFTQSRSRSRQECIPVGCVPAAHWPYAAVFFRGGVFSLVRGVFSLVRGGVLLGLGGGYPWYGGFFLVRGGSPWGWGSVWSGGGSPWSGGFSLVPGGSAWSGGVLPGGCLPGLGGSPWSWGGLPGPGGSPCRGGSPETPPVNRITDTCKNITLATTSLRPVTRSWTFSCNLSVSLSTFTLFQTTPFQHDWILESYPLRNCARTQITNSKSKQKVRTSFRIEFHFRVNSFHFWSPTGTHNPLYIPFASKLPSTLTWYLHIDTKSLIVQWK